MESVAAAAATAASGWSAPPASRLHDTANNNKEQRNRNYLLQQDVQAVVSEKGKQKIQCLLDEVHGLLPIEQLLLYLRLPTEQCASVDPLRQSMNPLGSRTEISQTIIWIRTHLEEDKELSLQKKGVYDDYVAFCEPNGIKPLSTADFGKVMKQVYPNVRPRRLGTRGQSKYCYSGLRSRVKLGAPLLPDLSDKAKATESACAQSDYMPAAWYIIKEWAEEKLAVQFQSAISLAYYLVKELSIALGSEAAQIVTALATSTCSDAAHYGYASRHKETTMQLQRKLQQAKESKRKQAEKGEQKGRGKRLKQSPPPPTSCCASPMAAAEGRASPQQPHEYSPNCDSANNSLPDFNSFHRPPAAAEAPAANAATKPAYIGKAAITRIAKQSAPKRGKGGKYKMVQQKPEFCDIESFDSKEAKPPKPATAGAAAAGVKKEEALAFLSNDASPYFSRERLESVSQVSKDALDEYLGTSNSQEQQEEEIIKYLGNDEEEDKLTQLRELLVQNCPPSNSSSAFGGGGGGGVSKHYGARHAAAKAHGVGAKRRVSFDTNVQEEYAFRRRDEVNFIPISSPTGGDKQSMCSSASASPFVSPRNTPILRAAKQRGAKPKRPMLELKLSQHEPAEHQHHHRAGTMVNLPMSAPPSPKIYSGYGKFCPGMQASYAPLAHADDGGVRPPPPPPPPGVFRSQSVPVNAEQSQFYTAFSYAPALSENLGVNEIMSEMEALPADVGVFRAGGGGDDEELKFPSRSVPNTPLPYRRSAVEYQPFAKGAGVSSKSYPTTPLAAGTFSYGQGHDYLLNGQPIKDKPLGFAPPDDGVYASYADGEMLPECELINKSNIDDIFKVVPD